ncbi:hypothetical protein [Burkholderia sp. Bp9131]|uniref:hypothetical protein n=1 Tax=Burkholderia sp. Bp9131 TaxID=2184571 RepID=UPI001623A832
MLYVKTRQGQFRHVGEVRQAPRAGLMLLREEDFLRRAGHCPPVPDAPLERAACAVGILIGMIVLQPAQDRDRLQLRCVHEHRNDFGIPDVGERIGARAPVATWLLGRQRGFSIYAPGTAHADPGLGGGDLLRVLFAFGHVEANLLVGNAGSGHAADRFFLI